MEKQTNIIRLANGYHVWTRKVGESPIKVLLLHGGPGLTHEYLENFQDYLLPEGIELYFYDQLGSYFSDQPDEPELWTIERFCEEVEEVRVGLGLDDFYLYGHSWGGMLAIDYALKYGEYLKGLIISSTTASMKSWDKHLLELRNSLPPDVIERMDVLEQLEKTDAKEYLELYWNYFGKKYICRTESMPEAVVRSEARINEQITEILLGTAAFEVNGLLRDWNRWDVLQNIDIPSLVITGRFDTMRATEIEEMARLLPMSRSAICENGSHLTMWDEPDIYFRHLITFLKDVEDGSFLTG